MQTDIVAVWHTAGEKARALFKAKREADPSRQTNLEDLSVFVNEMFGTVAQVVAHLSKQINTLEDELTATREELAAVKSITERNPDAN